MTTRIGFITLLLGFGMLAMAQQDQNKATTPTTPPGLPPFPDGIVLKRGDPTPEQIEAAKKAQEAQAAAVRERWEKEFAPWLHVVQPIPPAPVAFDREKTLKEHAEKRTADREWVKKEASKRGLPLSLKGKSGGTAILDMSDDGSFNYIASQNLAAARTVRADQLWQSSAFNLHGSNVSVGVFEIGNLRPTHYLFNNFSSTTRATNAEVTSGQGNNVDDNSHATHVTGTLGGYFYNATNATGMARGTKLLRLDGETPVSVETMFLDYGAQLANLSVGGLAGWNEKLVTFYHDEVNYDFYPIWLGDLRLSTNQSSLFGAYTMRCFRMDSVLSTNRPTLAVIAAGNNRDPLLTPLFQPIPHVMFGDQLPPGVIGAATNGPFVLLTNITHDANGGTSGFDTLSSFANTKNALLVGSSSKNPDRDTNWVQVSEFSAFGPTDDGRIKPDIAAPGENLTSAISTGDDDYATYSGTSMSAPVVTGGLAMIQEYAKQLYGTNLLWNGATYKAIAISSADEMGDAPGPDYKSGYGLFNAATALDLVYKEQAYGRHSTVKEVLLTDGAAVEFPIKSSAGGAVKITVVWADPASSNYVVSALNKTNSMLVNDVDCRVIHAGVTNMPWVLDPFSPSAAATQGDNWRDNVEQVTVTNVAAGGDLLVRLTHKGILRYPTGSAGQWVTVAIDNARDETMHTLALQTMLLSTNQLAVSWPARVGSRFELLANDDLSTTNWTAITGDIVALKTNVSVVMSTTNTTQRFLQLRRTQ